MTDSVLTQLSPRFTAMYSSMGRPSIPQEQLLRALQLQSLHGVQSEARAVGLMSDEHFTVDSTQLEA